MVAMRLYECTKCNTIFLMTLKSKNRHIGILLFNVSNAFFVVKQNISRWYEGAYPWSVSNNQGIEGTNKAIKKDHTFKRRCPLGTFMNLVDRMVKEWSMVDDSLLFSDRMGLFKDRSGLKMRTDGYQWMKQCKAKGSDTIIKVDPRGKYTVSESSEFNLGKVEQLWVVATCRSSCHKHLKRLVIALTNTEEGSIPLFVYHVNSTWSAC